MKHVKILSFIFAYGFGSQVFAASVLVNQPLPYIQHNLADSGYSLYYGASTSGYPALASSSNLQSQFDSDRGYRFLNVNRTDDANLIWLDLTTDATFTVNAANQAVVAIATNSSIAGYEIPLTGAGQVSGNVAPPICNNSGITTCPGSRTGASNLYATYAPGSTIRVSFSVADLCRTPGVSGTICTTGQIPASLQNNTLTTTLYASFGNSAVATTVNPTPSPASTNTLSFNLNLTDTPPSVACPASGKIEDFYFPGDGQIFFTPGNYLSSVAPDPNPNNSVGVPVQSLVILADRNQAIPPLPTDTTNKFPATEVKQYVDGTGARQSIDGFQDVAQNDNGYSAAVFALNAAGIISVDSQSCRSFPENIKPRPVLGVLTESKCFIATAAYHDGHAAPVMMLREFRDEVLAKHAVGQNFIEWYYRVSPALAEWAWDKPFIRSIALRALAPLELIAWATLKFVHAEETSTQPYIDLLKKKMPAAQIPTSDTQESYSESERRKLMPEATPSEESYTEKLKKQLGEADAASNYSDTEAKKLKPEQATESPTEAVKAGRDKYPVPERGQIKNALGFKLGINPGVKVTNPSNPITFEGIYGSGWQPDLILHYERQILRSETYGSLALSAELGVSYAEGFGQLLYGFGSENSTQSITKLSFVQLPILIGAYYRFNLFRILRPYAGIGIGSMFFTEIRNDGASSKRGYSFMGSVSVGAALLLDFFDRSTALDGYLSSGIQHTYLTAEYLHSDSFSKTNVNFSRSGMYAGFLFEI